MALRELFSRLSPSSAATGQGHQAVVVGTEFTTVARLLYFGTGGTAVIRDINDVDCTYKNIPDGGTIGPFLMKKVVSVVSAADIVAIY